MVKQLITKVFQDTDIQITIYYPPKSARPQIAATTRAQAAKQVQKQTPSPDPTPCDPVSTTPKHNRKRSKIVQGKLHPPALDNICQEAYLSVGNFRELQQQDKQGKAMYDFLKFDLLPKDEKEARLLLLHESDYVVINGVVYHVVTHRHAPV